MKKLLSFFLALSATAAVFAQPCTPNPQYADSSAGIWPTPGHLPPTIKCLQTGTNIVFDIKTLTDTCVTSPLPVCVWVQKMKIANVSGLPNGFTIVPNTEPWANTGSIPNLQSVPGCALLSASNNVLQGIAPADYNIIVSVDMEVKNQDPNSPLLQSWTWTSSIGTTFDFNYILPIWECESIDELPANRFGVAENFPNPFTGTTTIPFISIKEEAMDFKVYDVMGKLVHQNRFISQAGKNMYVFNASALTSGVYMFTLSNGKETATRKMIIQN